MQGALVNDFTALQTSESPDTASLAIKLMPESVVLVLALHVVYVQLERA